jgi:predicted ATPase/signal transduction histidine kinase
MSQQAAPYRTLELLYDAPRFLVFRGERADGQPVTIKQLRGLYPEASDVAWSRREYDILRAAAGPGVLGPVEHTVKDGRVWLVLEPFAGRRLSAMVGGTMPTPVEAIDIASGVAQALEGLRSRGIVHKNISPDTVLWDRPTNDVKLVDFSIASTVRRELHGARSEHTSESDPRYVAPEQTGRVNRPVDHRSDFYALGGVLFWLLTGRPPFTMSDRLDLLHAQIARQPDSPSALNPGVPEALSRLVLTLLAKRAEDRYQSAEGILRDLERCRQLALGAEEPEFSPRSGDVGRSFQIADRLYGRSQEIEQLRAACASVVSGATQLLLVSGPPGIGKTSLVQEILEPATLARANLIEGKFDQVNRGVPYASLIQALRQLVVRIRARSPQEVARWRERLLAAVGNGGRALTELLGELELVIGPQPPLDAVPPDEAKNRLELVFSRFVRALADADHPLILFLDDLQWADLPSLRLLETVMLDPESAHTLIIGAYRDNEVGPSDALARTLTVIGDGGVRVGLITLGPLTDPDIVSLISESLRCTPEQAAPLARVSAAKTGGNPFYLRRFLAELHAEGLLTFAGDRWRWSIDDIERQSATENVLAFMSRQLCRLPDVTQRALERAACIGTNFDLHTVAALLQQPHHATQRALEPAIERDLVRPLDQRYWVGQETSPAPNFRFAFAHDRIQQAAYDGLPGEQLRATHLAIGRNLLGSVTEPHLSRAVFDIVGHLNLAVSLIDDPSERERLARLNLAAGRRALASAAYAPAHQYLQAGVALLDADAWRGAYQTALDLHVAAAQAAYLVGDDRELKRLVEAVLQNAASQLDRLRAQETLVYGLIARGELLAAVNKALDLLQDLGFTFPRDPQDDDIGKGLTSLLGRLQGLDPASIVALPDTHDPRIDAARKLMTGVASAAYLTVPKLLALLAFSIVDSTLDDGVTRDSPYGFALLALVLSAARMPDLAHANGRLAMTLLSRWDERSIRVRPTHVFNSMVRPWVEPAKNTLADLLRNHADGMDTGDLEYAFWSAHNYAYHIYYAGMHLDRVATEIGGLARAMEHHRQLPQFNVTVHFEQLVANLRGEADDPSRLKGRFADEDVDARVYISTNYRGAVSTLATCMTVARVFFRRYDEAAEVARRYAEYRDGAVATLHVAAIEFYDAVAHLAATQVDVPRAEACRAQLAHWERFNPANFAHWRMTIDAELARVRGDVASAMSCYDQAIDHAARNGLIGDEAFINERAAEFHLARGSARIARTYLLEARTGYQRWGAVAKVADLDQLHGDLLLGAVSGSGALSAGDEDVDLEAQFRASLALSEEIRLDHLLRKVVEVTIQNAGATRGLLLTQRQDHWVVAVGLDASGAELVAPGVDLIGCRELATSVVDCVDRTGEPLVVADATLDRRFSSDPYVRGRAQLSILCAPLAHQGRRHGIIYLDNQLLSGCFTAARLKTVRVLAAQAAVSIANASLVDGLESKVAERTAALQEALEQTRVKHRLLMESREALIESERLAVLGQLVAGVAHELNTPLGAIGATAGNLGQCVRSLLDTLSVLVTKSPLEERLALVALARDAASAASSLTSREERQARRELTARLTAEEISDPEFTAERLVGMGVTSLAPDHLPLLRSPDRARLLHAAGDIAALQKGCSSIQFGVDRSAKIVFALKSYAHPGSQDAWVDGSLAENLDTVLTLYGSLIRQGVTIVRDYATDTVVEGMHARLNQVWTNLVHNALQAMDNRGTLTVRIGPCGDDRLAIRIIDTGPGVPLHVRDRMFEPFFTTKGVGEGCGLGLPISKDIVDAHGGSIELVSEPGHTEFVVTLARHRPEATTASRGARQ